ncbi:hypothetical protein V6x_19020 [Gimesia chilikensis]|uniref:Uncharacterized protein n=1 Tax=Gimesia chilikensis TaxID=2605989 RepID=A0A517WAD3_9PLAN|nr:hypothetical protein V6x_19020 [Gimesia chilikensis]
MSSSSPPVTVVPPGAEIPPTRSTVPPTASGSPTLGSTKIPMVVAALIWEVASMVKSSPAVRTTLDPVDSTVTPGSIVRSSPATAESVAVRVTVPAPVTLLETVSGLDADTSTNPRTELTPTKPSTEPIVKAPVLLIRILPFGVVAASVLTAVSISAAPTAPMLLNASKAASSAVMRGVSPAVLSTIEPLRESNKTRPPTLRKSAIRISSVVSISRSPPRASTTPPSVCVKPPPPAASLSATRVTAAAEVVSTTEVTPRVKSLSASRSMLPPFV